MQKMATGQASRWLWRRLSSMSPNPLRVCVVGSGPAGFYTAEKVKLLRLSLKFEKWITRK